MPRSKQISQFKEFAIYLWMQAMSRSHASIMKTNLLLIPIAWFNLWLLQSTLSDGRWRCSWPKDFRWKSTNCKKCQCWGWDQTRYSSCILVNFLAMLTLHAFDSSLLRLREFELSQGAFAELPTRLPTSRSSTQHKSVQTCSHIEFHASKFITR